MTKSFGLFYYLLISLTRVPTPMIGADFWVGLFSDASLKDHTAKISVRCTSHVTPREVFQIFTNKVSDLKSMITQSTQRYMGTLLATLEEVALTGP